MKTGLCKTKIFFYIILSRILTLYRYYLTKGTFMEEYAAYYRFLRCFRLYNVKSVRTLVGLNEVQGGFFYT